MKREKIKISSRNSYRLFTAQAFAVNTPNITVMCVWYIYVYIPIQCDVSALFLISGQFFVVARLIINQFVAISTFVRRVCRPIGAIGCQNLKTFGANNERGMATTATCEQINQAFHYLHTQSLPLCPINITRSVE